MTPNRDPLATFDTDLGARSKTITMYGMFGVRTKNTLPFMSCLEPGQKNNYNLVHCLSLDKKTMKIKTLLESGQKQTLQFTRGQYHKKFIVKKSRLSTR